MQDRARWANAEIPTNKVMATNPELAANMLKRSLDAAIAGQRVLGDAIYEIHADACTATRYLGSKIY